MQAQELEPTEILPSPTIIAYHLCNWDDNNILLNGAVLGEGLSVHYSGGGTLAEDVSKWLARNNVNAIGII